MENKNINKTPRSNKDRSPPNGRSCNGQESPLLLFVVACIRPPLEKYKIGVKIVYSLCKLVASTKVKERESST